MVSTRPTLVNGYLREPCSHRRTLEAQVTAIENYWAATLSHLQWVGNFIDHREFRGIRLLDRAAGRALNRRLSRGDHVVLADTGVAFPTPRDFACTIECWIMRGIQIHLLDLQIDGSTKEGLAALWLAIRVAGAQGTRRSEITAACHSKNRFRHRPVNQVAPVGYCWAGRKGDKHLTPNLAEMVILNQIIHFRDVEGMTWGAVSDAIETDLAARDGRTFRRRSAFYKRTWPARRCQRAYIAAKRLVESKTISR